MFLKISPADEYQISPTGRSRAYDAIGFYNIQRQGLGLEFAKEVEDTIERIKQNPEAWTTISMSKQARRCLTNRFP